MTEFILVGGGGHAAVVAVALRRAGQSVLGFVGPSGQDAPPGLPWLGTDESLASRAASGPVSAALGIGKTVAASHRLALLERLAGLGVEFPPVIATSAIVHEDVELGLGTVVLDGAIVATGSRLGRGCIINTHATVDHGCRLGDDVHVAPGATLSGGVRIGDGCMIGAGATVIHAVSICSGCTIGAGATVTADLVEPGTYLGTPSRRWN